MASIARKKKDVDLNPKMVPNQIAISLVWGFLNQTGKAFEEGIIQNAGDWGIVAAHLHAFAHYMDEGDECGMVNAFFNEGLVGDRRCPLLSEILTKRPDDAWKSIAPDFIAEQQGR